MSTDAETFVGAGPWICITVAGPVRSVNPKAEPYPTDNLRVSVEVSKVMPDPISFPEPTLLVTTGTSFEGLRPTAWSVPAGERSKFQITAWEAQRLARSATVEIVFFIGVLVG